MTKSEMHESHFKLVQTTDNLNQKLSELEGENVSLRKAYEKFSTLYEQHEEVKDEISKLQSEKEGLQKDFDNQKDAINKEKEHLELALIAHDDMYNKLEAELTGFKTEHILVQERCANEVKLKEDAIEKVNELRLDIERLENENCELSNIMEGREKDAKEKDDFVAQLKDDKNELNKQIQELEARNAQLSETLETKETVVKQLTLNNEDLTSQVHQLEEKLESVMTQLEQLQEVKKFHESTNEPDEAQPSIIEENKDKLMPEDMHTDLIDVSYQVEKDTNGSVKARTEPNKEHDIPDLSESVVNRRDEIESDAVENTKSEQVGSEDHKSDLGKAISFAESKDESSVQPHIEKRQQFKKQRSKKFDLRKLSTDKSTETTDLKENSFERGTDTLDLVYLPRQDSSFGSFDVGFEIPQASKETEHVLSLKEEISMLKRQNSSLKERIDSMETRSDGDTDTQILEDMREAIQSLKTEKDSMERQRSEMSDTLETDNKRLQGEIEELLTENDRLRKKMKTHEELLKKENHEVLKMYNDLRNEVEILVISKHDLEIELMALKEILEHESFPFQESTDFENTSSRELTDQDIEDMKDIKTSIEKLKRDLKEKDLYVKQLEQHFLQTEGSAPDFASTPKPLASRGQPLLSKAFVKRRLNRASLGRRSLSHDMVNLFQSSSDDSKDKSAETINDNQESSRSEDKPTRRSPVKDDMASNLSLITQVPELSSSINSDNASLPGSRSLNDSFSVVERIKSGLRADEDGHLALELKQYELVGEITKLRRDLRETKSVYAKEIALLSDELEKERVSKELKSKTSGGGLPMESSVGNDFLKLRKEIARLKEENKMLIIDNDRWIERLKEQEQIVLDLKAGLSTNASNYGEVEEVFGRQVALLQKQREELISKLKDREDQNYSLTKDLGEKGILEETLRREKDELKTKLEQKEKVEKELADAKVKLEKQTEAQKELENLVYQKDMHEIELMKQKRLLEEQLKEIEAKFRDREENLDYEKNHLLNELRVSNRTDYQSLSDRGDVSTVSTEVSGFTDCKPSRLEMMLSEVERQHALAVSVLKEQLEKKHRKREERLREEHSAELQKQRDDLDHKVT